MTRRFIPDFEQVDVFTELDMALLDEDFDGPLVIDDSETLVRARWVRDDGASVLYTETQPLWHTDLMIDAPDEQTERQLQASIVDAVGSIPFETLLDRAAECPVDRESLEKPSWLTMAAVVVPEGANARLVEQIRHYAEASDPAARMIAADAALQAGFDDAVDLLETLAETELIPELREGMQANLVSAGRWRRIESRIVLERTDRSAPEFYRFVVDVLRGAMAAVTSARGVEMTQVASREDDAGRLRSWRLGTKLMVQLIDRTAPSFLSVTVTGFDQPLLQELVARLREVLPTIEYEHALARIDAAENSDTSWLNAAAFLAPSEPDPRLMSHIRTGLQSKSAGVRYLAAHALWLTAWPDSRDQLAELARVEPDVMLRAHLDDWLSIGAPRA